MKYILLISLVIFTFYSCKKKDNNVLAPAENPRPTEITAPSDTLKQASSSIKLKFQTVAGTANFKMYTNYTTAGGELIRLSRFQYYLSNFVLTKTNGSKVALPNTYFLLDAAAKDSITLTNVSNAEYSGISFLIGIDSTKSKEGAHSGDLDPVKNMFMEWSGYTYLAMEGLYGTSSPNKDFAYIIRGYSPSRYYAVQNASFTFDKSYNLNKPKKMLFKVDILEAFKNPSVINISSKPKIDVAGMDAVNFSINYKDMFYLVKTEE